MHKSELRTNLHWPGRGWLQYFVARFLVLDLQTLSGRAVAHGQHTGLGYTWPQTHMVKLSVIVTHEHHFMTKYDFELFWHCILWGPAPTENAESCRTWIQSWGMWDGSWKVWVETITQTGFMVPKTANNSEPCTLGVCHGRRHFAWAVAFRCNIDKYSARVILYVLRWHCHRSP